MSGDELAGAGQIQSQALLVHRLSGPRRRRSTLACRLLPDVKVRRAAVGFPKCHLSGAITVTGPTELQSSIGGGLQEFLSGWANLAGNGDSTNHHQLDRRGQGDWRS